MRFFLWFCTNEMPNFGGDKGKWVYDRMIIVKCNNVIPFDGLSSQKRQLMKENFIGRFPLEDICEV